MNTIIEKIKAFFEWLLNALGQVEMPTTPTVPAPVEPVPGTIPPVNPPAVKLPIQKGDKGTLVGTVQKRLKQLGFDLTVDDDFWDETVSAVRQFQEANQIGRTGVVGPQTWTALFSDSAKGPIKLGSGMIAAAEYARMEAKKNLQWTASGGLKSEAEKFLASVRKLIGVPTARFAWCAAFVFWCLQKAGVDMSHLGTGAAYVPSWVSWAKSKGFWHPSTEKSFNPRLGDIVIFDWNDVGTLDPEHIGFVLGYDGGAYVMTAEGNTSNESDGNGDSTALRSRHWDTIEGFIRVT